MKDDLQKSDSCGLKSERKKILTSSTCSLACLSTNLGAFCPMVVHLPSEKSILPYFSGPRGVAILDCDSHSQAGSTTLDAKYWVIRFWGYFWWFLSPDYTAKSLTFKIWVFLVIFMHLITFFANLMTMSKCGGFWFRTGSISWSLVISLLSLVRWMFLISFNALAVIRTSDEIR